MKCKYCDEEFAYDDLGNNCIGCGYTLLPEDYDEDYYENINSDEYE